MTEYGTTTRIGFIGAGNMGGAVARRLATGGWTLRVFDPSAEAVARCTAVGAAAATSVGEAVSDAEIVVTSLPTPEILRDTVSDVLPLLATGTVLVDISTIDPVTASGTDTTREASAGANPESSRLT